MVDENNIYTFKIDNFIINFHKILLKHHYVQIVYNIKLIYFCRSELDANMKQIHSCGVGVAIYQAEPITPRQEVKF